MRRAVQGFCPSCGAYALALTREGLVICLAETCTRPTAAGEILATDETNHIVELYPDDFSLQHPLRERLDGDLFDCRLHAAIASSDGPPAPPGRYAVSEATNGALEFIPIERRAT